MTVIIITALVLLFAGVMLILEILTGIKKDRVIDVLIDGIQDTDHAETKHAVFNRSTKASVKVKEVLETSVRNRQTVRRIEDNG